jgi:uncharacterized membrane protein YcfT
MRPRIEWIDLVKSTSVLLVVFMHASNTLVDLGGPGWVTSVLVDFNHLVEPLRMPVFFLVSGMLASSAIRRPWAASTNRTVGMLYLYVLWMLLYFGFTALFGADVNDPLGSILFAKSGYWYLYAMALFFVIARLLRSQPAWLVVLVALVPNLLRPLVDQALAGLIPGTLFTSMTLNLGFFLLGAYFKDVVGDLAQRVRLPHTVVLGAVSVAAGIAWRSAPGTAGQSYLLLSVLWVAFGVSVAVLVTRNGAPAWARYVGARTLPIYVLQWPVLFLIASFAPAWAVGHVLAQVLFPFAVTAVVAGLALLLHRQSLLAPLFTAPQWLTEPQHVVAEVRGRASAAEPASVTVGR